MSGRDWLCDWGYDEAVVFESPSFDDAIVGITVDGRVVYDYERMVACLMKNDGISEEDAVDFISYNTLRALSYVANSPIVVQDWAVKINGTP